MENYVIVRRKGRVCNCEQIRDFFVTLSFVAKLEMQIHDAKTIAVIDVIILPMIAVRRFSPN
jgi:hypothetical protein